MSPRSSRGFSLVEVTLALGVAGFCLVSLFGLLPIGVTSNLASIEQTAAASAAASVIADLRATSLSTATVSSPQFFIPVPADTSAAPLKHTLFLRDDGTLAVPSGTASSSSVDVDANPAQNPHFRVTVTFMPPAPPSPTPAPPATPSPPAPATRKATIVRVLVTWPAMSTPRVTDDPSPARLSGSFDLVTALDRH